MIEKILSIIYPYLDAIDGDFYDSVMELNDGSNHCSKQTDWNSEDERS